MTPDTALVIAAWCLILCTGMLLAYGITFIFDYLYTTWVRHQDDDVWEQDRQRERIRQALGDDQ